MTEKVKTVIGFSVIRFLISRTHYSQDENKTRTSKVEDGEDVILTDSGNLVTLHHFYLIKAGNTATL